MLIPNQLIDIKWVAQNKEYYKDKGYKFTKYGDYIKVHAEDLQHSLKKKIKIICDCCGVEYEMTANRYFRAYDKSIQFGTPLINLCNDCKKHIMQDNLYTKALEVCEKTGYTILTKKEEITSNVVYIDYLCPIHGKHTMMIKNFIYGKGCPDCSHDNARERYKMKSNELQQRVQSCGGMLLNPDDYVNQTTCNLQILCPECHSPFITSLRNFTQHGGQLCDNCQDKMSIGEKRIQRYLIEHDICFESQKWFSDCRDKNPLPFDFYLPSYNIIIEFDGRQHFEDIEYFTYRLKTVQKHDKIKNTYCMTHGINLIRIPYWDINKIETILDEELILHEDIV